MKTVRAFSPSGRKPESFKSLSLKEAKKVLASSEFVEAFHCSFAFKEALGLRGSVRVFKGVTGSSSTAAWELVVSESEAFITEDGIHLINQF